MMKKEPYNFYRNGGATILMLGAIAVCVIIAGGAIYGVYKLVQYGVGG